MKLPDSLHSLASSAAEEYARKLTKDRSIFDGNDERLALVAYRAGFTACYEALSEGAGEFDKPAAIEQAKHEDSDGYFGFLTGAEWQHQQMRAQLEAHRQLAKDCQHEMRMQITAIKRLTNERDALAAIEQLYRQFIEGKGYTCP